VFDLTNAESFRGLARHLQQVRKFAPETIEMIVVGAKMDLESSRQVSAEQAREFVRTNLPGVRYIETSSKDGTNVEDAVVCLISEILHKNSVFTKSAQQSIPPLQKPHQMKHKQQQTIHHPSQNKMQKM
jgi:GTPase SAR1 family protein